MSAGRSTAAEGDDTRRAAPAPPGEVVPAARAGASPRLLLITAAVGAAAGLVIATACWIFAGVSLGLFMGPLLLVTVAAPALAMSARTRLSRWTMCGAIAIGVWLVWLATANLSAIDALRCCFVFFTYVLALAGLASAIGWIGFDDVGAAATAALVGVLWLTWPVWLSPWLSGPHAQGWVNGLTIAHPLMATNAILFTRFNVWDRYTLAYQQLTILNQDVLYALPRTIAWAVGLHGLLGAGGMALGCRSRSTRTPDPRP